MAEVRQGWRFFRCEDCEAEWRSPSRDARSPSGDGCPECGSWVHPNHYELDESLPVDLWGNLMIPWTQEPLDQ